MSTTKNAQNNKNVNVNKANMDDERETSKLPKMKDCKVTLEHLPPLSCNIGSSKTIYTENKSTTTDEPSKKIYKMITIDNKVMFVEQSEYKLKVNSDSETLNDCPIIEEYLEEDIFDEEPNVNSPDVPYNVSNNDDPLQITIKSDEDYIDETSVDNTIANNATQDTKSSESIKNMSIVTHHKDSNIKVFAYSSSITKNDEKQNNSNIKKSLKTTSSKNKLETNKTKPDIQRKNVLVDKEIFKNFYATNNPFKDKVNHIQRDLVYENPFPTVYIGRDRNEDDSNTGKNISNKISSKKEKTSNNEDIKEVVIDYNETTSNFEVVLDNQLDPASKTMEECNNEEQSDKDCSDDHQIQLYKKQLNNIVQDFVDHFADIMNYKWYNSQDVLIYGRNGTAMVVLHEAKYIAMKEIITGKKIPNLLAAKDPVPDPSLNKIINERNMVESYLKRCQNELKILRNENDIYEKEYCCLKQTIRRLEEEMNELRTMKENLSKIYSPAQIRMMTPQRRNNVHWTDDDIKKAIILYQMTSGKVYKFLKWQMKFPLPSLRILEKWMNDKKMYIKPKKVRKSTKNKTWQRINQINVSQETCENLNSLNECGIQIEEASFTISDTQNEDLTTGNLNTTDAVMVRPEQTETEQAVEMITEELQNENIIIEDNACNFVQSDDMNEDNLDEQYYVLDENYVIDGPNVTISNTNDDRNLYVDRENQAHDSNDNAQNNGNDQSVSKSSIWELDTIDNYGKKKVELDDRNRWKLTCKLCMKPCESEDELKSHVRVHYCNTYCTTYLDAETPYVCQFCNEQVKKRDILVRHHILHLGINEFRCWHPGCNYVSKNKVCLASHVRSHLPRTHWCPQCAATFTKRKYLREHFGRKHSARVRRNCPHCAATCLSDYTYHLHLLSHDRPPRYKCPEANCSESFYSRRDLLTHRVQHGAAAPTHQCALCPLATFSQAMHLNRHMEYHEKFKIAQCSKCQKIFDSYTDYYMHIKTEPHISVKYSCVCSQIFKSKIKFGRHRRECPHVDGVNEEKRKKLERQKHKTESNEKVLPPPIDFTEQTSTQETTMDQKETLDGKNRISEQFIPQNSSQIQTIYQSHNLHKNTDEMKTSEKNILVYDENKRKIVILQNITASDKTLQQQTIKQTHEELESILPVTKIMKQKGASHEGKRVATLNLEQVTTSPNKKQKLMSAGKLLETGEHSKIITLPKEKIFQELHGQNSNKQEIPHADTTKNRVIIITQSGHSETNNQKNDENSRSSSVVETPEYSQQDTTGKQNQDNKMSPDTSTQPDMPHIDDI